MHQSTLSNDSKNRGTVAAAAVNRTSRASVATVQSTRWRQRESCCLRGSMRVRMMRRRRTGARVHRRWCGCQTLRVLQQSTLGES